MLFGYDPAEQRIHHFSLNRYASRDHVGHWTDGDTLHVEHDAQQADGRRCQEAITIHIQRPDPIIAHVIEMLDGEISAATELTLRLD